VAVSRLSRSTGSRRWGLDLLQVADGSGDVIAEVVNNALNGAAVKEVTISVRQLGFQDAPHTSPSNRVC